MFQVSILMRDGGLVVEPMLGKNAMIESVMPTIKMVALKTQCSFMMAGK
jgi:hypothetical protein